MAANPRHIQLAKALPERLTRFFARYPPAAILPQTSTTSEAPSTAIPNPFKAQKHPVTGKWHDPVFSLRRQADLIKLAQRHGVEELMPFSVKSPAERLRRREENGLRVKGTGVGQRVKGKEDERQLKARCVVIPREEGTMRRRRWDGILGDGILTERQTREEETGYVGDATDDPDLEGGKDKPLSPCTC